MLRPLNNSHWSIIGTERCPGLNGEAVIYSEPLVSINPTSRTIIVATSAGNKTLFIPNGLPVFIGDEEYLADQVSWNSPGGVVPGIRANILTKSACTGSTANPATLDTDPLEAIRFPASQ